MTGRAIKLVISYDGTDYGGWQRQKNARSIQEELEKALASMHGHPVRLTGAGRTDAGVHAMGQVAGFFTDIASIPSGKFLPALNRLLPRDIRILQATDAPDGFHARFDASFRAYRYFIMPDGLQDAFSQRFAWCIGRQPSLSKLNAMASVLPGEHDFTSFSSAKDASPSKCRYLRDASFSTDGMNIVFHVSANAFLWRMVRSLVGTMLFLEPQASDSREASAMMRSILDARDRKKAGPTAPPFGLFLWNVEYGSRLHGHARRREEESKDFEGPESGD